MRPLISVMTSLREVVVAAIKSLLRGKSFIEALLAFWIRPSVLKDQHAGPVKAPIQGPEDFLEEAESLLLGPIDNGGLKEFAERMKLQFRHGLWSNPACMLPSYNHQLPSGYETGQFLALDVGGSTLRVALVDLRSRGFQAAESIIVRMETFKIGVEVKSLQGVAFFDWMAERIQETLAKEDTQNHTLEKPLLMGLAWSFPVEQTSARGGKLQGMGKGFRAEDGLLGQDLGDIINLACRKKGLHVELSAIVNDSSATLLSQAYINPSTRFGLILGTGVNIAAHLPVTTVGLSKYGDRPSTWTEKAGHVIVNTELGMFGKDILPLTKWDEMLKSFHPRPDFQPLEHLVSGMYLGEVCRLVLVDAIESTGIFGGVVPPTLLTRYSLSTETMSDIEADESAALDTARSIFASRHPSTVEPAIDDMKFLKTMCSYISRRSASIVAASLVALWELKTEAEAEFLSGLSVDSAFLTETDAEMKLSRTMVAFNGSVIEHYPNYQENLKGYINSLLTSRNLPTASIDFVLAKESSLLGAAVALASLDENSTLLPN
ncbi:hexokinase-1 [Rhypophila decipiens]|uniref:Phosphotransferase n=1 Tax=Rhypophila decipiens TaxID=261697 RepID=A0AAN7BDD1_9PEZI|nr:hexokinase-1 [Rhypophila decipiens]